MIQAVEKNDVEFLKGKGIQELSQGTLKDIELARDNEKLMFGEGSTPLHVALGLGKLECVKYLLKQKVKQTKNRAGSSEIHILLLTTDRDVIEYAMPRLKKQLFFEFNGDLVLHLALKFNNRVFWQVLREKMPGEYQRMLL